MKNGWKILIVILAICAILFVATSSFIVHQENEDLLNYGDSPSNYSTNKSIELQDNASASDSVNITKGNYSLVIDCDANWKLNYTVDGKNYQKEGSGDANISLGTISSKASIDFNQISDGSTNIEIHDSNDFVSSIYQAGKTVKIHYELNVV